MLCAGDSKVTMFTRFKEVVIAQLLRAEPSVRRAPNAGSAATAGAKEVINSGD